MRYAYGFDWIPGGVLLGTVLLLLIVPPFALIALVLVALAALVALVALAGAVLATPYLLVRTVRRRLAERHQSTKRTVPIATAVTALAGPTTARRAQ
jgi:positive regulator of sigma E activity